MRRTLIGLVTIALLAGFAPSGANAGSGGYVAIDVSYASVDEVAAIESSRAVRSLTELGDLLVVRGDREAISRVAGQLTVRELDGPRAGERLYITHHVHPNDVAISRPAGCEARVVASSGVWALVATTEAGAALLDAEEPGAVSPFASETVLARGASLSGTNVAKQADGSAAADAVDAQRWLATVTDLANFKTRLTGSAGANAARDYVASRFTELGLTVDEPGFPVGAARGYDVVGELRGTSRPDDVYIVCGHYDSISETPQTLAPGAEDNGSGAAGVVELARVFAANPPAATVRFIVFSGEEEGLYGSKFYVDQLKASGEAARVKGVVNMDMIGYSGDEDLDVLLETNEVGADLQDRLAEAAAAYTNMRVVRSLHPFGSDHVPFLRVGIPCVLTIENDWDEYAPYHTSRDTIENVRADMGGQVLRMNAATIAALAGESETPSTPTVSISIPFPTTDRTIYGGFIQDVEWTIEGGEPTAIKTVFSRDGGMTFEDDLELDPTWRNGYFLFASTIHSRAAVYGIRVTFADGAVVTATTPPFRLRPGDGPALRAVRFPKAGDGTFEIKGRFDAESNRVEVNGVAVEGAIVTPSRIRGNTCNRIEVSGANLDDLFPVGVEVVVRVVDARTQLATGELRVTR